VSSRNNGRRGGERLCGDEATAAAEVAVEVGGAAEVAESGAEFNSIQFNSICIALKYKTVSKGFTGQIVMGQT